MRSWTSPDVPSLDAFGAAPALRLHDSARGSVETSSPEGTARMYVCGITPYDATHLGHAATMIAFDLVNRAWRDAGHPVRYVQNVTDVDDPLLERAAATGIDWTELAYREIQLFRDDMTALRVIPPQHYIGVVESIDLVSNAVEDLQRAGAVYSVDGDLYFAVKADAAFGGVSGYDRQTMTELFAERGGDPQREGKKNPLDPLLWRRERVGEPAWDGASLGTGRPGWHIECAVIARDGLGLPFDLQGGGADLLFPHHEMSTSHDRLLGGGGAGVHVHAGLVAYEGEKMSKSRGNLVFVSALRRAGVDPMAIRLALLAHHSHSVR